MSSFTSEAVLTGFGCASSDEARLCRDERS